MSLKGSTKKKHSKGTVMHPKAEPIDQIGFFVWISLFSLVAVNNHCVRIVYVLLHNRPTENECPDEQSFVPIELRLMPEVSGITYLVAPEKPHS